MNQPFVHIVESPDPADLFDGRAEGTLLQTALALAGTSAVNHVAADKEHFKKSLSVHRLTKEMGHFGGMPVVHISAHGCEDGLTLTSGESVSWDELREILVPLNVMLSGELLVCISACYASNGCTMAMKEHGALPFQALVGSRGAPTWADTAVAFTTFYHLFFSAKKSLAQAAEGMRIASNNPDFIVLMGSTSHEIYMHQLQKERLHAAALALAPSLSQPVPTSQ